MNFINTVAQTSNAFVNAASGFVGHRELGGTWDLDVSAKPVAPFSLEAREGFRQVLVGTTPEPLTVAQFRASYLQSGGPAGVFTIKDTPNDLADLHYETLGGISISPLAKFELSSGATVPLSISDMAALESMEVHFPINYTMEVEDTAKNFYDALTSSDRFVFQAVGSTDKLTLILEGEQGALNLAQLTFLKSSDLNTLSF